MMQPEKEKTNLLARYLPILHWLPHYNKAWLSGDIVAGLSVWALMVPQCLGFAAICGVPVQYGLYAAAIALIVYAIFASSRHVITGPSSTIAAVTGSWPFIVGFFAFLMVWMGINSIVLVRRPYDPYPFILLNLVLSCLAALQAPVIMMSQNRWGEKDRMRAEKNYQVNLKAEMEIRNLHDKIDHLLLHQWQRLLEIQQQQLEVMDTPRPK